MTEHGDYDYDSHKWFCNCWQTSKEWEDIHDYSPPLASGEVRANSTVSDPVVKGNLKKPESDEFKVDD